MRRTIAGWMMMMVLAATAAAVPVMGTAANGLETPAPMLAEMPMSEPWQMLGDTPDIRVFWHSDTSAVLLLTDAGAA
ncbi:MAG TPA: hypothetical protein PLV45_18345, partial [bacterium]|nr:hypothetical protein [bacterium]